jgi:ubiquinone/menaquinone biosynthesis C-methylase UbiE
LYTLYINHKVNELVEGQTIKLLDIAPSPPLTKYLKKQGKLDIRTADLEMEDVDDHVDITDMQIYPDNSFDAFICSHVLEHIDNDVQAMKELHRVLKPGGSLILVDSLNHNPVYIFNRIRHLVSRNRSLSTVLRIPKLKRIEDLATLFEEHHVQFFGIYLWLHQFAKVICGRKIAKRIYNFFESRSRRKKLAFKFVFLGKNFKHL